ncbi:MAG: tricarballylate utilization 4Fe-4S protein TcuB [Pseudomonadota bacterium]|nr:tricarballylate utilization 4Fe-4S protein TcuB [Pseudomonadota bacterium]
MSALLYQEAARVIGICNSCRYCEGYCAMFPAMERRIDFAREDLDYLANLCHQCGACYAACQYAPPHQFAVNVPSVLAQVRLVSYESYAWPRFFAAAFRRQPALIALTLAASLTFFFALGIAWRSDGFFLAHVGEGSFYAIFPHNFLVTLFGLSFGFACVALAVGAWRFWREIEPPDQRVASGATLAALKDAAALTYLEGGGEGCPESSTAPTQARRVFHHLTFYGFMFCLASTSVASIYHYALGRIAPYAWSSVPVLLGVIGGVGLVIGPIGLLWLRTVKPAALYDPAQSSLDVGFTSLLLLIGLTGLLLLGARASAWMPSLLALHLGPVLALFLLLPYGKFVHGIYRTLALVKYRRGY